MADNKHEAKIVRRECISKQKKTYYTSGHVWTRGNANKVNMKMSYSPPLHRRGRQYANSRSDKLLQFNDELTNRD